MKKMLMAVALFATMMFTGCSTDYKAKGVDLVEDYAAAIEKAETMDDLEAAQKEYKRAQEDLNAEMEKSMSKDELEKFQKEAREDKEFMRQMEDALEKVGKAYIKKQAELLDKE